MSLRHNNCRPRFVGLAARPRAATRHARHDRAGGARPLPFRPRARAVGTGSAGCAGLSRISGGMPHVLDRASQPPPRRDLRQSGGGEHRQRPPTQTNHKGAPYGAHAQHPSDDFSAPVSARPSRRPLRGGQVAGLDRRVRRAPLNASAPGGMPALVSPGGMGEATGSAPPTTSSTTSNRTCRRDIPIRGGSRSIIEPCHPPWSRRTTVIAPDT
jgi:hypothetical protein